MKKTLFHIIFVILISLLAYSNTFNVPFVFDDDEVIVRNPIIKDLNYFIQPSEAAHFYEFFEYNFFKRRYVAYLTFALNYKVHGLDVRGYHFVNLLIHIISSIILYSFVIATFNTPFLRNSSIRRSAGHIAFLAALFFVCHPIQTQAITYIWQRGTSLTATFYLFSLLMYVRARLGYKTTPPHVNASEEGLKLGPAVCYTASILSAVLAMKTKSIAITLPVSILLYEFMFMEGTLRKRIISLFPYFLLLPIIPLSLMNSHIAFGDLFGTISNQASTELLPVSRLDYLFTEFRVLITYIRLIFLPINQNLDYYYPLYNSFFNPSVFLSFLFLLSIFSLGVYFLNSYRNSNSHTRLISFGIFWFFITLSVESTFIPIKDLINEHRMYLPSIGVFTAICTMIIMAADRLRDREKNIIAALLAVIIITLTGTTYARNMVWMTEISLWSDVVSKSPKKSRALTNLAKSYMDKGFKEKALTTYQAAIKNDPNYFIPYYNLGNFMKETGKYVMALDYYNMTLRLNPGYFPALTNIAIVYKDVGNYSKAIEHFLVASRLKPYLADVHINLGIAYRHKKLFKKAAEQFKIALKSNPNNIMIHLNLGAVYEEMNLYNKAKKHYAIVNEAMK